jgi:hypothetical protein
MVAKSLGSIPKLLYRVIYFDTSKNVGAKHIALRAWLRLPGDNLSDQTMNFLSECFAQGDRIASVLLT